MMSDWNSDLSLDDAKLLIEILEQWEKGGDCSSYELLQSLKTVSDQPMPENMPDELKEHIKKAIDKLKSDLIPKEKDLKNGAEVRKERATLLRAKLIILSQKLCADKLSES